eukprot:gene4756-5213_t
MEQVEDSRFSSMMNAPLFKKTSHQEKKVLLDDRFKAVLTDDRFRTAPGAVVDKYGRKKKNKKNADRDYAAKELEEFYKIEDNNDNDQPQEEQEGGKGLKKKGKGSKGDKEGSEERLDYLTKLARGEVDVSSSSEDDNDDDSSSEDENDTFSTSSSSSGDEEEAAVEEEEEEGGKKSALDVPDAGEVEYGEESTHRLAVLNCDWEHLKATDIMMVLQSFCPVGRTVKEVTVYPSDFGLERMAVEEKFGPQGIWKQPVDVNDETEEKDEGSNDEEEDDGDEEEGWEDEDDEGEEEEDDLYDRVEYLGSDDDEEEEDEEQEDEKDEEDDGGNQGGKKRRQKEGDLRRQQGAVGLVFADDLKQKQQLMKNKKNKKNQSDIDEVALREYELSKLKYYFAIVIFDSIETANIVYEECDGLELENSAMTFDLRFVPNEEDFSNRQGRDRCNSLPSQYSPPDFIVNALQHTKVQCRDNAELSDEEDDDSDDGEGNSFHDMDGFGSAEEGDDFFLDEEQDDDAMNSEYEEEEEELPSKKSKKVNQKKSKKTTKAHNDDDDVIESVAGDDEDEMVLTYIPDADKEIQAKKKLEGLSPFELDQLKQKEKKKTKKEMRKAAVEAMKAEQEELRLKRLEEAKNLQKKEKLLRLLKNEAGEEEEDDEEGRLIVKDNKNKKNKKIVVKSKAKKRLLQEQLAESQQNQKDEQEDNDNDNGKQPLPKKFKPLDNFKVNTQDTRFAALFEGDARYGIDLTSSDFKATPGVQTILEEQRKRRRQREENGPKDGKDKSTNKNKTDVAVKEGSNKEVNQLVDRLKNKFRG